MALKLEVPTSNEWHILKGEVQYGPYNYEDMILMLQNRTLFGFDYVWSPHLDQWTALSDLPEFSIDRLNRLAEKAPDDSVFLRRKTDRLMCRIPVLVHDHKRVWKGLCENISAGGALVLMENPLLLPGEMVTLHFRNQDPSDAKASAFNATAEILTKRLTKQRLEHDSRLYYALRFVHLQSDGSKQIEQWVQNQKKKDKQAS